MSTFRPLRCPLSLLAVMGFTAGSALMGCGSSTSSAATRDSPQAPVTTTSTPGATGGGAAGQITIKNYTFVPTPLTVPAGTTVTWTNTDAFEHEITAADSAFAGPKIQRGTSFTHQFDKAGSYKYYCGIHNYMTGSVTVT